jgi:hypothetical protein
MQIFAELAGELLRYDELPDAVEYRQNAIRAASAAAAGGVPEVRPLLRARRAHPKKPLTRTRTFHR